MDFVSCAVLESEMREKGENSVLIFRFEIYGSHVNSNKSVMYNTYGSYIAKAYIYVYI